MSNEASSLIESLGNLRESDFDYSNMNARGDVNLDAICHAVTKLPDPSVIFPEFFRLMERLSEVELGTPGPLVHTMEQYSGRYETHLIDSIKRKPTELSVWMINRILNGNPENQDLWMSALKIAANHPLASESVKDSAVGFIQFQNENH
jgi:hypothetical protein